MFVISVHRVKTQGFKGFGVDSYLRVKIKTDVVFQVRRQGRMLSGEMIDITRPLPVRTVDFGSGARNFPDSAAVPKKFTRMDVGPVFDLEDMLRKQAAKLKAEVREASLKAAKAAEEAEKKLEDMVKMVVEETEATKEEVESIVSSLDPPFPVHHPHNLSDNITTPPPPKPMTSFLDSPII